MSKPTREEFGREHCIDWLNAHEARYEYRSPAESRADHCYPLLVTVGSVVSNCETEVGGEVSDVAWRKAIEVICQYVSHDKPRLPWRPAERLSEPLEGMGERELSRVAFRLEADVCVVWRALIDDYLSHYVGLDGCERGAGPTAGSARGAMVLALTAWASERGRCRTRDGKTRIVLLEEEPG